MVSSILSNDTEAIFLHSIIDDTPAMNQTKSLNVSLLSFTFYVTALSCIIPALNEGNFLSILIPLLLVYHNISVIK